MRCLRCRPLWLGLLIAFGLASCDSLPRDPVPPEFADKAAVLEGAEVRYWGDRAPPNINALAAEKWAQARATRPYLFKQGARPQISFLAVSGGGSDGAFGAGLLVGWTARGDRPEFDIVTGISTGALTAPFAFLGPRYDPALKVVYTTYSTDQLVTKQPVRGLLGGEALSSNAPLARVIASYVTEDFLKEVAHEHNRGRRLLIGTTNLDAQRPVIWDMGKIATSGDPQALELFRVVLLASAAIPAVFPPVYIKVQVEGQVREEMHVDGGTTNQVFLLPTQIRTGSIDSTLGINPVRRLYIIRNGRVAPEYKAVKASTLAIAGRSISTLIKTQGIGDLYQMSNWPDAISCNTISLTFPAVSLTRARKPLIPNICRNCTSSVSSSAKVEPNGRRRHRGWATPYDC